MSKQTINIGASPNDGTGTPLRTSFDYTNQNFTELYTALGGGVGLPGATTQVIFNDGGTNLAGDAGLVYNKTTDALTVAGLVTAGSATISGDLTVDTSTLKVDSANNRVGIGTASPSYILEVVAPAGDNIVSTFRSGDATAANNAGGGFRSISSATAASRVAQVWLDADGANFSGGDYFFIQKNGNSGTVEFNQSSNAAMTFLTNGTERARIDSSGNVGVGVTPSVNSLSASGYRGLEVGSVKGFGLYCGNSETYIWSNLYYDGGLKYANSNTAAASFYQNAGQFIWYNAPSSGVSGAGTAATLTPRMTLDASGNLLVASGVVRAAGRTQIGSGYVGDISGTGNNRGIFIGSTGLLPSDGSGNVSDNTYDLGDASYRWDTVFAGTGTINTSDRNDKQDIADLSASEKRVASSIKQLVKKYRFKDAVASKGENARIHVGWIAQDIQSAFAAEGLDASKYGVFCSDTWYEVNGNSVDSDKKPYTTESENAVAKTRLGLRHDELLAFVVSNL